MNAQWKWVVGVVAIVVVFALLACGIFIGWRYFFPQKLVVTIDSPPSNTEVQEGDTLWVEVTASGGSIKKVELWIDGNPVDQVESPSPVDTFRVGLSWVAEELGRHMVEVRASNTQGQESDPAAIVIRVVPLVGEVTPTPTPPEEVAEETPTPSPTSPPAATATATPPPSTATPTLVPPVISYFTIDDDTITEGETTTLRWEFSNATASRLYRDGVEIASGLSSPGTKPVNPSVTRTFKLVVSNAAGSAEASVVLTVTPAVTPAPVIHYFKVNGVEGNITISAGSSVTLEWDTDNAWGGVRLNGAPVVSPSSKTETPGATTTYTLEADNGAGDVASLSRTVTVTPAAPVVRSEGETTVPGGNYFDLDDGVYNPVPITRRDFRWVVVNPDTHERKLVPLNGAVYAITGSNDWEAITYSYCTGASFSGAEIIANQGGPNHIPGTMVVCYRTNEGRFGKFQVTGYVGTKGNDLRFRWRTWE